VNRDARSREPGDLGLEENQEERQRGKLSEEGEKGNDGQERVISGTNVAALISAKPHERFYPHNFCGIRWR
jgi:hypothetical protein